MVIMAMQSLGVRRFQGTAPWAASLGRLAMVGRRRKRLESATRFCRTVVTLFALGLVCEATGQEGPPGPGKGIRSKPGALVLTLGSRSVQEDLGLSAA